MSFFLSHNTPKSMSARASPQTPLGELITLPKPSSWGRFTAGGEWGEELRDGVGGDRWEWGREGKGAVGGIALWLLGDRRPLNVRKQGFPSHIIKATRPRPRAARPRPTTRASIVQGQGQKFWP